jgi:hypothetical protein
MNSEEYLKGRLEDQIDWYSKKSKFNKRWFLSISTLEIVAATSIPFLVNYIEKDDPMFKITAGLVGVLVAILTGIIALWKFQELWIQYRSTCESLKHHKYLYETKTKPYNRDDSFSILVENVEILISKEHSIWGNFVRGKPLEIEKDPN